MENVQNPGYLFRSDYLTLIPNENNNNLKLSFNLTINNEPYELKFQFFRHNFNSESSNVCDLLKYHNKSRGMNCQFIGFLDSNYNVEDLKNFISVQPGNFQFIFIKYNGIDEINNINTLNLYNNTYNKTLENKLFKLSKAYSEIITETIKPQMNLHPLEREIETITTINEQTPISGEYILINNSFIPTISLIINPLHTTKTNILVIPKIVIDILNNHDTIQTYTIDEIIINNVNYDNDTISLREALTLFINEIETNDNVIHINSKEQKREIELTNMQNTENILNTEVASLILKIKKYLGIIVVDLTYNEIYSLICYICNKLNIASLSSVKEQHTMIFWNIRKFKEELCKRNKIHETYLNSKINEPNELDNKIVNIYHKIKKENYCNKFTSCNIDLKQKFSFDLVMPPKIEIKLDELIQQENIKQKYLKYKQKYLALRKLIAEFKNITI